MIVVCWWVQWLVQTSAGSSDHSPVVSIWGLSGFSEVIFSTEAPLSSILDDVFVSCVSRANVLYGVETRRSALRSEDAVDALLANCGIVLVKVCPLQCWTSVFLLMLAHKQRHSRRLDVRSLSTVHVVPVSLFSAHLLASSLSTYRTGM